LSDAESAGGGEGVVKTYTFDDAMLGIIIVVCSLNFSYIAFQVCKREKFCTSESDEEEESDEADSDPDSSVRLAVAGASEELSREVDPMYDSVYASTTTVNSFKFKNHVRHCYSRSRVMNNVDVPSAAREIDELFDED